MNENQIKSIYMDKLRGRKSFNGLQAPVVTAETAALLATIAEVVKQEKGVEL